MGKKSAGVAGAVVVGAVAGYVAGILTAPKSGKETRQDIKKASAELKKNLEVKLQVTKDELAKLIAQATEKVISEKMDSKKDQQLISEALK